jgi:oligopeptide/dipeptide ABC transporter ATP-binding protein
MSHLLTVDNLQTRFRTESGSVNAVNGISYYLDENEVVGLVGESGCGKTASQLSVMRLLFHPSEIVGGKIIFEGKDLLEYPAKGKEMCAIRGGKIAMVFQEPTTALNPVLPIGRQIAEMMEHHLRIGRNKAKEKAIELLSSVKIPEAENRYKDYPHQFSGGMLQRVMIAMAISCNPKILIADEPTSSLDVTTQASMLNLIQEMISRRRASMLLVTHNLGIVARYAQRIYVMYAGQIIESGASRDVFSNPRHPYTIGLLNCLYRTGSGRKERLFAIKGSFSDVSQPACAFMPRCNRSSERCCQMPVPELTQVNDQHFVRCHGAA